MGGIPLEHYLCFPSEKVTRLSHFQCVRGQQVACELRVELVKRLGYGLDGPEFELL